MIILSFPVHELYLSIYLVFNFSQKLFLQFSVQRFSMAFIIFILKYFMISDAIVDGAFLKKNCVFHLHVTNIYIITVEFFVLTLCCDLVQSVQQDFCSLLRIFYVHDHVNCK